MIENTFSWFAPCNILTVPVVGLVTSAVFYFTILVNLRTLNMPCQLQNTKTIKKFFRKLTNLNKFKEEDRRTRAYVSVDDLIKFLAGFS